MYLFRVFVALSVFISLSYAHSEYLPALFAQVRAAAHIQEHHSGLVGPFLVIVHNTTGTGTNAEACWSKDGKLLSFQVSFLTYSLLL